MELFRRSPWTYILLLLWVLKLSHQNGIEDKLQNLENLIVGQFVDMNTKLSEMDLRLRQLDNMDNKLSNVYDSLRQMDIDSKFSKIEAKLNQMDDTFVNNIKGKVENIELEVATQGERSSLSLISVNEIKEHGTALLEEIKLMKQERNIVDAAINNLTLSSNTMSTKLETIELLKEDFSSINSTLTTILDAVISNLTVSSNQMATQLDTIVNETKIQRKTIREEMMQVKEDFSATNSTLTTILDAVLSNLTVSSNQMATQLDMIANETMLQRETIREEIMLVKEDFCTTNSTLNSLFSRSIEIFYTEIDNQIVEFDKSLTKSVMMINKVVEEKTLLTMNPIELKLFFGQEAQLDCGVIGVYQSCHWEHDGFIYQLADVINGSHSNITTASRSISNQCAITITSVSASHDGVWTCQVLTIGQTLTASKKIILPNVCPQGFINLKGSRQCFKLFNDTFRSWESANTKCTSEGLHLAELSDAVAVTLRKDTMDTYGEYEGAWLGGRYDGSNYLWQRRRRYLLDSNPLWEPNEPSRDERTTDHCLYMEGDMGHWRVWPGQPYRATNCSATIYTLCEVIRE